MAAEQAGLSPTATPETLSDMASQADLGPLAPQTALMVKLAEARLKNQFAVDTAGIRSKLSALEQKYIATLRELRDKLMALRLDDILKIGIGILGGLVARTLSERGIKALEDPSVDYELFFLLVGFVFLIVRGMAPLGRRKEINAELKKIDSESVQ
jgi:hypothetical protein